jgi:hypothetical protein
MTSDNSNNPQTQKIQEQTMNDMSIEGDVYNNADARLMALQVFKRDEDDYLAKGLDAISLNTKSWHERNTDDSFLKRKIASHIKKKSKWLMESIAKGRGLEHDLPDDINCTRICNNISLQISRHTSRHSRVGDDDDSSTDSDDDVDSFCGDELETADETEEVELGISGRSLVC